MLGGSTTVDDSSEFALGSSDVVDASVSLEGDVERTPPRHERGPSLVHDIVTSAIDKAEEESAEAWEAVDAAMERATEGISKSGSMAGSRPPTAASQGTQVHNLVEDAIHNVEQQAEQSEIIHTLVDGVVQNVIDSAEKNPDDRPPSVVAHDVSTASNTQEFDESNEYSADFESADPTDPSSGDIARSLMPSSKLSSMQDMEAAADVSEMSPKAVGGATGDLFAATRKTTAEPQPDPEPEPELEPEPGQNPCRSCPAVSCRPCRTWRQPPTYPRCLQRLWAAQRRPLRTTRKTTAEPQPIPSRARAGPDRWRRRNRLRWPT